MEVSDVMETTHAYRYIGSVTASMTVQMAWMKSTAPLRKDAMQKISDVEIPAIASLHC
jgi:hypothetical protein